MGSEAIAEKKFFQAQGIQSMLGVPIVSGLQLADTTLILSGAVPAALLALLVDGLLGLLEKRVTPRGLEIAR